jgi:Zn-dependent peptidase ImmA (M78 family)/transcriptional regulator with XRE-family HTH domain
MSFADAIVAARKARGWTQEELAEAAGITQAALSRYETGARVPDEEVIPRLAAALQVTERFLEVAGRFRGAMAVTAHMRRRATAKPTVWRTLEARLNVLRMHAFLLFEHVSLRQENSVPTFDPLDTRAADAARFVRTQWKMPIGPVVRLTNWLESAGCIVIEEDFGTTRVDGLSQWIEDHPVILMNSRAPTERKRLTLAHETGHLCLHATDATETMEHEANAFAAEFMMPREVIRSQLRNLTLGKLHDLKREWGVSMQALIERASELEMITASQRTNLYKLMSYHGWRVKEPLSDELQFEQPRLPRLIGDQLARSGFSESEIDKLAGFGAGIGDQPFRPTLPPVRQLRVV